MTEPTEWQALKIQLLAEIKCLHNHFDVLRDSHEIELGRVTASLERIENVVRDL